MEFRLGTRLQVQLQRGREGAVQSSTSPLIRGLFSLRIHFDVFFMYSALIISIDARKMAGAGPRQ